MDTNSHSMPRVRAYKESDLYKLEELYRQNFPHLEEGRL